MNVASIKNTLLRRVALAVWFVAAAVIMAVIFPLGAVLAVLAAFVDSLRDAAEMVYRHWRDYVGMIKGASRMW